MSQSAVVLLIDTCRYDEVGRVAEIGGAVTPNIDRFTKDAARFTKATAPAPWTLPSVGSLLTSLYPTAHGALGRYPEFSRLRPEVVTAAEVLRDAGFRTGAIINVPFLDPVLGLDRGFDTYDIAPAGNRKYRRADATIDAAIRWIEEEPDRPFFLFVHLFDPHMDYDPPEPFLSRFLGPYDGPLVPPFQDVDGWKKEKRVAPEVRRFARALYRAEIAAVDEECGRFFAYLDSTGLAGETAVVVTADHGEEFWEHGGFEHGHSLYEELIHVPLVIRAPGRKWPGEVKARVGLVDVMPTLFELLGVRSPAGLDGVTLVPLLDGRAAAGPAYRYAEALLYGYEWKAAVGERYKFSWDEVRDKMGLFDLEVDPAERLNIADEKPEVAREMAAVLLAWFQSVLERTGDTLQGEEIVDLEKEVVEQLRSLGYIE